MTLRPEAPAPVATPEGMFGEPQRYEDIFAAYDAGPPPVLVRFLVAMLALAAALFLAALSLQQATSEEVAMPAQERGLATLTEIDALIAFHRVDLEAQLAGGATALTLPAFPLADLGVPAAEVTTPAGELDVEALRARLLSAGAGRAYADGAAALDSSGVEVPAATGSDNAIELVMDVLTDGWHGPARLATLALGAVVMVLAVLLVALSRSSRALGGIGVGLVAAGVLVAAGAVLLRLAINVAGPGADDPVLAEYASVVSDLAALPLRNGLVFAGLGLALALPAWVVSRRG